MAHGGGLIARATGRNSHAGSVPNGTEVDKSTEQFSSLSLTQGNGGSNKICAEVLNPMELQNGRSNVTTEVFITYGDGNEQVMFRVREISDWLNNGGIDEVPVDYEEEKIKNMNINSWLNESIEGSKEVRHFVIVCIDKEYKNTVCNYKNMDEIEDQDKSQRQYIFDALQTTIIRQGCLNYKYLPVLINGAKFSDVPLVFQSTKVYSWPKDMEKILNRLLCRARYVPPRIGAPPVPVVEDVR